MRVLNTLMLVILSCFIFWGCDQINNATQSSNKEKSLKKVGQGHQVIAQVTDSKLTNKSSAPYLNSSENSVGSLYRYPAEEKEFIKMASDTAFTRDIFAGGETYVSQATDGDTWNVEFELPDTTTITGDPVKFYDSYNGKENCFVSSSFVSCGSKSITILWYTTVQCDHSGNWNINFLSNGKQYGSRNFYLKPQIPPGRVPAGSIYNQGTYSSEPYDHICKGPRSTSVPCKDPYTTPWSVQAKGCYITAGAMILSYHGVNVNPSELNTWLSNNDGYNLHGDVFPYKIAEYGRKVGGVNISYRGRTTKRDKTKLKKLLCKYGPQMIGTKLSSSNRPGHWITATGQNINKSTILINDPDGGDITTLKAKYHNEWSDIRAFSGPKYVVKDNSEISVRFYSPGELVLTDPSGRRIGRDPISGTNYNELPKATYAEEGLTDDSKPLNIESDPSYFKEIEVMQPIDGDYKVNVIGTGTGSYSLGIRTVGSDFNDFNKNFKDFSIWSGVTHSYKFTFNKDSGSQTDLKGGYDGGGQRPRDVNKFLSYSNPSQRQITLPAGVANFSLHIFYGKSIIPNSFTAELNRNEVSSLFNPTPDTDQVVNLSLSQGRNVLVLSVDGRLPKRNANDKDRLVIKVQ